MWRAPVSCNLRAVNRGLHGALAGLLIAMMAPAARGATVSVPANTTITVGSTVQVEVDIDDATGLEGADLALTYDPNVVLVTGNAALTTLSSGCMPVSNTSVSGSLQVSLACQSPLSGGGALLTIPMQGQIGGSSAVSFTRCDINEDAIPCTPVNGSVTVVTPTPSETATPTPSYTATPSATQTGTATATKTPTASATVTLTPTRSLTATTTPTATVTATATATATATPTATATQTPSLTQTRTPTLSPTVTLTPSVTSTVTQTRTSSATRTTTSTRTATPAPTVSLDPIPGAIPVGGSITLTGQGFTAGSVIALYVATSNGVQQFGPFTPTTHTATSLLWNVPATVPLANGFGTVQVVNTDEGFIASNVQPALLQGAAAAGFPGVTAVNGVALSPPDVSVPLANVATVAVQNSTLTVTGTGFTTPVVALFSSNPNAAALEPLAGGTSTQIQVVVPADIPTGPGSLQVLNRPSFKGSILVSLPIGERIRLDSVSQSGSTITVNGAGFSTLTVISFFNAQGNNVVNLGGLVNGTQSLIPLNVVSSHQFTFQVPSGAVSGPSYVQALNPPFIPFTSTGNSPNGAFDLVVP
jgi:hypothetical protein